ncbi:MAG: MmgE/PrpD family protein [Alphaproteobacteria bacterium]
MSQIWTTDLLAHWCISLDPAEVPDEVIAKTETCILDVFACAIAGRHAEGTACVMDVASAQYRNGPADAWFSTSQLHPTGAAFINSTAASILDLDDGHRGPCGHPGSAVIPAALAVAQETNASGLELLGAVIAGYEVCTRIGASEHRTAYHTGNWSGFGAAVAAAQLRGLSAEHLAHALAITAYHGPRIADLTLSADMGSNVKESIPWSVVVGLNAADLAARGFSGCRDALDIDERFKPGHATSGLGDGFQIMRTYFKRYSACRWVHSAVEAMLQMMDQHDLVANDIETVHVETFRQAANLNNLADPPSPESAQYSLPFCLGLAATKGEGALMPMAASDLHDPAAQAFANKVTVVCDRELATGYPAIVPSRVTLNTRSGRFEVLIERPWGEPDGPTGRADLIAKFRALAVGRIPDDRANAIIASVEDIRNGSVESLIQLLVAPTDESRKTAHG